MYVWCLAKCRLLLNTKLVLAVTITLFTFIIRSALRPLDWVPLFKIYLRLWVANEMLTSRGKKSFWAGVGMFVCEEFYSFKPLWSSLSSLTFEKYGVFCPLEPRLTWTGSQDYVWARLRWRTWPSCPRWLNLDQYIQYKNMRNLKKSNSKSRTREYNSCCQGLRVLNGKMLAQVFTFSYELNKLWGSNGNYS